ncbi:MAG: methyltransferase domain-containing protein, partial [Candidatus Odinarchaeota archaeon]
IKVFLKHFNKVKSFLPKKYNILELGPGDSISTAIIGYAFGASKIFLVDVADYAYKSIDIYRALINELKKQHIFKNLTPLLKVKSFNEILKSTNASYYIDGLQSLQKIPSESIDFIFSNAVLEHINFYDFKKILCELYRVSSKDSITSHTIDLKDHINNSLNSLRFSKKVWESKLFVKSGLYTNRLRFKEICKYIREAGFKIISVNVKEWDTLPIKTKQLSLEFKNREDLQVYGFDILCKKS